MEMLFEIQINQSPRNAENFGARNVSNTSRSCKPPDKVLNLDVKLPNLPDTDVTEFRFQMCLTPRGHLNRPTTTPAYRACVSVVETPRAIFARRKWRKGTNTLRQYQHVNSQTFILT